MMSGACWEGQERANIQAKSQFWYVQADSLAKDQLRDYYGSMAVPYKVSIEGTFYSVEEAARALGLAINSVRRYCNAEKPKLYAKKVGRDWMIPKSEIDRYRKERNQVGRPIKSA